MSTQRTIGEPLQRFGFGLLPRSAFALAAACASAVCIASPEVAVPKVTPAQWKIMQKEAFDRSEAIFTRAQKLPGLLAQYQMMSDAYDADPKAPFRIIFSQYLSWYQTYVGDYTGARRLYSIRQLPEKNDAPSPLNNAGFVQRPALDAIAELAHGRQAVFFNEAHNVPLTRTLTVELLERLRQDGFDYFAAETLYDTDPGLQKRGYPTSESGFYVEEPIYAEMIRTAIKLGFTVVAYDASGNAEGDAREREQAKALYERVFKNNPKARLVVNAGYAHIQKDGKYLDGKAMAYYFRKASGIEPLAVEQTMMIEHDVPAHDHPYYRALFNPEQHPKAPVVYVGKDGKPWSLKPGWYDVSVFFPPDTLFRRRPTWLDLDGLRKPYQISADPCAKRFPCLIEARYEKEGDDAIPADRILLEAGTRPSDKPSDFNVLYLRPGRYRLSARSIDNRVQNDTITVSERP